MPLRRRQAEAAPRRWPAILLVLAGLAMGVALWAYAPSLPPNDLIQRYANQNSQFIDIGGARAHVRDEGNKDGIPIVLIHGSMGSLHMWEGWVDQLKDRARLISVDLPGHGLTGAWPREEYTIEAYADFIEVLADTLNLDRFALVGHSMGGAVAWTFAATRPDRVSQLILVDSAGIPRDGGGAAPLPIRLARLPVIGDLGIWFKPEFLVKRSLAEVYADPAMVTPERVTTLQHADAIVREEIHKAGLERELWQAFAVLPDIRSVGVMGDERTYAHPIIIRAVTSEDAMTADWARLPYELLETMSSRIINEVRGVNRVAYDITSKPPGTIEWE